MVSELIISGQKIEAGTKVRGYLRAGPYFHHKRAYVRRYELMPFTVIRGYEDGPVLCQNSGCHGTEYAGIDGTIRLTKHLEPENIKGTFIAVHPINVPGFWERTYINPVDGRDMQRSWPGDPYGSIAERMTYTVFKEAVLKADYFLDCHGGDIHESTLWYAIYYRTDDEIEEKSEEMVRASGLKYAARYDYRPKRAMGMEATKRGVAGFLYELGTGDKLLPEESDAVFFGTQNVMKHLGMLDGSPVTIKNQPRVTEDQEITIWKDRTSTYFIKSGLYHSTLQPGDCVEKDQIVGTVTDLWGDVIEEVKAPATGQVSLLVHNPVVRAGEEAIIVRW